MKSEFSHPFVIPISSATRRPSTILLLSPYGKPYPTQHRHGVRRWWRSPPKNFRLQEERGILQGRWDLGHFYTNSKGFSCITWPQDLASRHKSKFSIRKSANVFLCRNGVAKLGDMNVSKVVRKEAMCETQTGTPYYASPEVWHDQPYDSKSDIWSLGCVLYEFINLKPPFRARDM